MFDLTGMNVYQTMRPVLPPSPPDGEDPFAAAMRTIMSARPQTAGQTRDESGETLAR